MEKIFKTLKKASNKCILNFNYDSDDTVKSLDHLGLIEMGAYRYSLTADGEKMLEMLKLTLVQS